jgi:hypothetical protein
VVKKARSHSAGGSWGMPQVNAAFATKFQPR